ncbi:MAG: hypothetical protein ACE5K4_09560 [Candidatus Hydrothermarchaeota archaeon]
MRRFIVLIIIAGLVCISTSQNVSELNISIENITVKPVLIKAFINYKCHACTSKIPVFESIKEIYKGLVEVEELDSNVYYEEARSYGLEGTGVVVDGEIVFKSLITPTIEEVRKKLFEIVDEKLSKTQENFAVLDKRAEAHLKMAKESIDEAEKEGIDTREVLEIYILASLQLDNARELLNNKQYSDAVNQFKASIESSKRAEQAVYNLRLVREAETKIQEAENLTKGVEELFSSIDLSEKKAIDAMILLNQSLLFLKEAKDAYQNKDYKTAIEKAKESYKAASISGQHVLNILAREAAEEKLDNARNKFEEAKEAYEEMLSSGGESELAYEKINTAQSLIKNAEESFKLGSYSVAGELAEKSVEYSEDAKKISEKVKEEAKKRKNKIYGVFGLVVIILIMGGVLYYKGYLKK